LFITKSHTTPNTAYPIRELIKLNMKKSIIILIILVIVIIGSAFYWYEYRPEKIKGQCSAEARLDTRAVVEFDETKRQEFINNYYEDCLMRFGLK